MNISEVTTVMTWIEDHRIDEYVKIDPLKDLILDLLETTPIEPPVLEGVAGE